MGPGRAEVKIYERLSMLDCMAGNIHGFLGIKRTDEESGVSLMAVHPFSGLVFAHRCWDRTEFLRLLNILWRLGMEVRL